MSVLDRFLNVMKLNDDNSLDNDDYLDDEYEDDYEDRTRSRILKKNEEDDDQEDELPAPSPSPAPQPKRQPQTASARPKVVRSSDNSKISPMRNRRGSGMEVCVIKPRSMEDAREITETLLEECTVVLNMEGLDIDVAQRIIDFSAGSCFALRGSLQKISNYIFIITPKSVDISGDFQEILNGAFDVPAVGTRF